MKCNFKISLPLYKLLYSMVFMFVMALIRPTVTPVEILTVIEPNLCFLAIVFVADIYYCEFRENRINVFYDSAIFCITFCYYGEFFSKYVVRTCNKFSSMVCI